MTQTIQTNFKRIETKYILSQQQLKALLVDLAPYLREDEFPTSTISNLYFDTPDFDVIKDALDKKHRREKIRMRSYLQAPTNDSQAFLEIKQKDAEGVGHKYRLVSNPVAITKLLTQGKGHSSIVDYNLVNEVHALRDRYENLEPRIYTYYDRYSLKQKKGLEDKVRITFDRNLRYRDEDLTLTAGNHGKPLLEDDQIIMEIKAAADKPTWLQDILDRHGLVQMKFSKYAAAYHKSQGLFYQPRASHNLESQGV